MHYIHILCNHVLISNNCHQKFEKEVDTAVKILQSGCLVSTALMSIVDILKENPIWYCERCTNPIHDESQASFVCDCC